MSQQPSFDGAPELPATLATAIAQAGMRVKRAERIVAPPASARELAADAGVPPQRASIEVEVAADESCVLLVEDEATGALSWHFAAESRAQVAAAPGARGLRRIVRFEVPTVDGTAPAGSRGLLASLGSKVTSLVFDAVDPLLGPIVHGFARKWEAMHRPCFARRFGPSDYEVDEPAFARMTAEDWRAMAQGPALLFVHGTFSTSGAFKALAPEVMATLSRRYGGRSFAFNHPTLTADPRENAAALLGMLPPDISLEVDIVCHSRGGLVARQIALLGAASGRLRVRRIVFVAATNSGTALADEANIVGLVNRYTTLANLLPQGPAKVAVDALTLVVKLIAHGLLHDLEGLAAMAPRGAFLAAMNVAGDAPAPDFFALASNFEPKAGSPFLGLARLGDLAADDVFGQAPNDLVVPEDGVFAQNGAAGFPIVPAQVFRFAPADGVIHTEFFAEPRTADRLLAWLGPDVQSGRAAAPSPLAPTPARGLSRDEINRVLDVVRHQLVADANRAATGASRGLGEPPFTPAELEALRPHVIDLREGVFKQGGLFSTTQADVDAMVDVHIPAWSKAQPAGKPLRIVVWAHGGLVGERAGLRIAQKHVAWWKRNGVYPIYFVWETGLFDALRSILESVAGRLPGLGARDLFDYTTDPLVAAGCRALGGVHIWAAMKRFAQLACADQGGARYLAQRLQGLPARIGADRSLELHAVGHSAGSIFHASFLPCAKDAGVPPFKTLQLLAPAITIDDFDQRLAPLVAAGGFARRAVMYTMARHYEEADDCIGIYHKSLLYLIHHALEPAPRTPILGLEISLRADARAAALFGLDGSPDAPGSVVWSVTTGTDGRASSRSTSHGGFDDDPATMGSVAANVLDAVAAPVPYTGDDAAGTRAWPVADEWLAGVDLSGGIGPMPAANMPSPSPPPPTPAPPGGVASPPAPTPSFAGKGARRALCVGIDAYPAPNALAGCVADTRLWQQALASAGFELLSPLLDGDATRRNILDALTRLVDSANPGDVLVFQYSGHGTMVPRVDVDESDPNAGDDETAFVPVDFAGGAFLNDADVRVVFERLKEGVNLTCFIDCCHSGTITRVLGANLPGDPTARARFIRLDSTLVGAHLRFRQNLAAQRALQPAAPSAFPQSRMRWIAFAACRDDEVAYESGGNGEFTRRATRLLTPSALGRSNRDFQDQVIGAFGPDRRQTPQLDCADGAKLLTLLRAPS